MKVYIRKPSIDTNPGTGFRNDTCTFIRHEAKDYNDDVEAEM